MDFLTFFFDAGFVVAVAVVVVVVIAIAVAVDFAVVVAVDVAVAVDVDVAVAVAVDVAVDVDVDVAVAVDVDVAADVDVVAVNVGQCSLALAIETSSKIATEAISFVGRQYIGAVGGGSMSKTPVGSLSYIIVVEDLKIL